MKRIEIINPSLHVFCYELQEAIQNGYEIDPETTPVTWGITYHTGMIKKNDAGAELFVDTAVGNATTTEVRNKGGRPKRVV